MKQIVYEDDHGMKHRVALRDGDDESDLSAGIPLDPIGIELVDWRGLATTIHNFCVDNEIYDLRTLEQKQALAHVANFAKRFVLAGFRSAENGS